MPDQTPVKRNLLFSAIAGCCAVLSALLLRSVMTRSGQGEILSGYSGFSIMVSCLVALTLAGLVSGQIGLIRGEKPLAISLLALVLNGAIFITAIVVVPR